MTQPMMDTTIATYGALKGAIAALDMNLTEAVKRGAVKRSSFYKAEPEREIPEDQQEAARAIIAEAAQASCGRLIEVETDAAPVVVVMDSATAPIEVETNAFTDPVTDTNDDDDAETVADGDAADDDLSPSEAAPATGAGANNPFIGRDTDALLAEAERLAEPVLNERGKRVPLTASEKRDRVTRAQQIVYAALTAGGGSCDPTIRAVLISLIHSTLKCGIKIANRIWEETAATYAKDNAKSPEQLAAEALKRQEEAEREERLRVASEIAVLENEIGGLAKDRDLVPKILKLAHSRGVVGEDSGVLAVKLTAVSRLDAKKSLAMCRIGAPSGGKSFVVDSVLEFMPEGSVMRVSGASAKSLFYEGGLEPNALKHKILFICEAASIAAKGGTEHEITIALRSLLSDNVLVYKYVDADTRETVTLTKHGPIAVAITTARDNVEPELLTRLALSEADESATTTRLVQLELAKSAAGETAPPDGDAPTLDQVRALHRLLELRGPFRVKVPFARHVALGFAGKPSPVRSRRDMSQILAAVRASTILHAYQRDTVGGDDHHLVAKIEDYSFAFQAFADGMRSAYTPRAKRATIILLETLERIYAQQKAAAEKARRHWIDTNNLKQMKEPEGNAPTVPDYVTATYNQIKEAMGVAGTRLVQERVKDALAAGVIEITTPSVFSNQKTGRAPSCYRLLSTAAALKDAAIGVHALPTPEEVQSLLNDPEHFARQEALFLKEADPEQFDGALAAMVAEPSAGDGGDAPDGSDETAERHDENIF